MQRKSILIIAIQYWWASCFHPNENQAERFFPTMILLYLPSKNDSTPLLNKLHNLRHHLSLFSRGLFRSLTTLKLWYQRFHVIICLSTFYYVFLPVNFHKTGTRMWAYYRMAHHNKLNLPDKQCHYGSSDSSYPRGVLIFISSEETLLMSRW